MNIPLIQAGLKRFAKGFVAGGQYGANSVNIGVLGNWGKLSTDPLQ